MLYHLFITQVLSQECHSLDLLIAAPPEHLPEEIWYMKKLKKESENRRNLGEKWTISRDLLLPVN